MTMYDIMQQEGAKEFLEDIERNSKSSKASYAVALSHFQNFLDTKNYTLKSIIKPLATGKINVYTLLNEFLTHLLKNNRKLSAKSVKAYMAAVKSYLQNHEEDIDIVPAKFKNKVKMPKIYRTKEEAIDAKNIRDILLHCNNRRLKPYLCMLGSGGMRTVECTTLRWCDVNFDESPTKVNIREEYTKTKQGRFTFISDEATKFLNEWKQWKYRERNYEENDLIFPYDNEIKSVSYIYTRLWIEFNKILVILNKDKRKDNSRRRKITLNSFRRFAKTTLADAVKSDFSEYLIGHSDSSYWSKKEDEVREIYKTKCMKYLTFLDYTVLEAAGKGIQNQLSEKDQRIDSLEKQMKSQQEQLEMIRKSMNSFLESKKKIGKELPLEIIAHALDPTFEGRDPKRPMSEWRKEREALDRKYGITEEKAKGD